MTDPARRVHAAWNNPGSHPDYHRGQQRRLRREWPDLAKALDALYWTMPALVDEPERPGRLPHEIAAAEREQGLLDASHVDNAARPWDARDDAGFEHQAPGSEPTC